MKIIPVLLLGISVYYSIANYGSEVDTVSGVIADIKSSIFLCAGIICMLINEKPQR